VHIIYVSLLTFYTLYYKVIYDYFCEYINNMTMSWKMSINKVENVLFGIVF
jgi:hypothetical protein